MARASSGRRGSKAENLPEIQGTVEAPNPDSDTGKRSDATPGPVHDSAIAEEPSRDEALEVNADEREELGEATITAQEIDADEAAPPARDNITGDDPPAPVAQASRRSGAGFLPGLLGGLVGVGVGFGVATYIVPELMTGGTLPGEVTVLKAAVSAQADALRKAESEVARLGAVDVVSEIETAQAEIRQELADGLSAIGQEFAALGDRLAQAESSLVSLDERLGTLEKRPVEGGAASTTALEAFGREMDAFRTELNAERQALATGRAEVVTAAEALGQRLAESADESARAAEATAETARRTVATAALGKIEAALESGAALDSALAELSSAGVEIPAALKAQSAGVPSLAMLKEAFPEAARSAISASIRTQPDASMLDRFGAFLRSQSGARSLTPREGNDADAVLSRAEAALRSGDVSGALAEIDALTGEAQADMAAWATMARSRIEAIDAVTALAGELK